LSRPRGSLASPESLVRVGLDDNSALELAAKCPWLDGREYQANDFDVPTGRAHPTTPLFQPTPDRQPVPVPAPPPAQVYVARDGFDLPGGDLDNMPIKSDTQFDCEASCNSTSNCVAYVFNKPNKKCFLKGSTGTLFTNDTAYTGYKNIGGDVPKISLLQTRKKIGAIGVLLRVIDNIRYVDCTFRM
jgi:hypothetical protein